MPLVAKDVSIVRQGRSILDCVNLSADRGAVTAIIGPNGAGKSTLLKGLSGELTPDTGDCFIDDVSLRIITPSALAKRRALVPQATNLAFPFTAFEVVMLGATVPALLRRESDAAIFAEEAMRELDISAFGNQSYQTLSGGEKQRVQIARALCQLDMADHCGHRDLYLLLDEPTSSLDLGHQQMLASLLREQAEHGRGIVVILHDLNLAASMADQIVLLSNGKVAASGTPSQVLTANALSTAYRCDIAVHDLEDCFAPVIIAAPVQRNVQRTPRHG
jgi:iron complex transport system ATP-binding protein